MPGIQHSHIPTSELTTSNMITNIWNPFIPLSQSVEQEEPLDLTVKTKESQVSEKNVKNMEDTSDFAKFYHTYYSISSRSLPAYPSYESFCPNQTSPVLLDEHKETRKRKHSSSTCESDESISGDEKKVIIENKIIKRNDDLKRKNHKKSKTRKVHQISSITDSCDCRFCYEDHIIKMRLKAERPWLQ
jgi:hypothetical protein